MPSGNAPSIPSGNITTVIPTEASVWDLRSSSSSCARTAERWSCNQRPLAESTPPFDSRSPPTRPPETTGKTPHGTSRPRVGSLTSVRRYVMPDADPRERHRGKHHADHAREEQHKDTRPRGRHLLTLAAAPICERE